MIKLITCKICNSEMASNAKMCPSCGAKNKKPIYTKWWAWTIVVIAAIGISSSLQNNNTNQSKTNNNQPVSAVKETPVAPKNDPTISKAEFDKIQNGMTYDQVVAIVGGEGSVMSETGEKGSQFYTIMYTWEGEGSIGANSNAIFQGGKMASKAQFGLK